MENKKYCVYEHIRNDTNQCFYVGKGTIKRAHTKKRNEHHDRIAKKYGMHVNILKDNLSAEEAFLLEQEVIRHYVFDLGYNIDIIGFNNNRMANGWLTNHSFGGDGSNGMVHTEEWRKKHSADMLGTKNPAYGKNYWNGYSAEQVACIKNKISNNTRGEKNPMYGVSPKDRMDKETYLRWAEKKRENSKGDKNPNYKNNTLHNKLKDDPDLRIQYYARPRGQNGRAKRIVLFDIDFRPIQTFDCITSCAEWIKVTNNLNTKISSMVSEISSSAKKGKPYRNYRFKFE